MGQPRTTKKPDTTVEPKPKRLLLNATLTRSKAASVDEADSTAKPTRARPKSVQVIKEISTSQRDALKRLADR